MLKIKYICKTWTENFIFFPTISTHIANKAWLSFLLLDSCFIEKVIVT